eukprot:3040160-Prymnesium_polylepis.1
MASQPRDDVIFFSFVFFVVAERAECIRIRVVIHVQIDPDPPIRPQADRSGRRSPTLQAMEIDTPM